MTNDIAHSEWKANAGAAAPPGPRHRLFAGSVLLFVTLIWGATFSLTKGALAHIRVFPYLTLRFAIATACLALFTLAVPSVRRAITRRTWWRGGLLGTCLYGGYALQTMGLQTTSAATSGFLTGLSVVMVPLLGMPILRARVTRRNWAAVAMAVAGLALLTGLDVQGWRIGDVYGLLCSVCLALQIVFTERAVRGEHPIALTTVQIAVLTVWCSLTTLVPGEHFTSPHDWSRPEVWAAILVCSLLGTVFAYAMQTHFQQTTSATATALIFTTEPLFAAIIGWFALGERMPMSHAVGGLLILASMVVADESIALCRHNA
ncbi:MAG: DMT family transporter [Alicyclobacillus sp.]|nr:DMT family transporter [Alicyclobacillus sp.]